MNKVFITGRGLITPLGKGLEANREALKSGKSGIVAYQPFIDLEFGSQVAGVADATPDSNLMDRKFLRFAPPAASMSVSAVNEALTEAGISREELAKMRVAVIGGVANGNGEETIANANNYLKEHRIRTVSPFGVPRIMPSTAVSVVSMFFGLKGESYDISAACATSALAIITAARLIRYGVYDIVIVGGSEPLDWSQAIGFNAMKALSNRNDEPSKASCPFDKKRDGFVLSSGSAWMILESEEHLKKRGGKAITEISGIAANSNATDMVVPDAPTNAEVMKMAVEDAGLKPSDIAYVNTHGTSTCVGDPLELDAIKSVFGEKIIINSTKSQTGHMIGATGAAEIIFSSIMLQDKFISPNLNYEEPMDGYEWANITPETRYDVDMKHVISNSFAFGGSNCSIVLSDVE
ncbi:MAG: beta-ketoacyl-[Lentisphaeria bacterium]|nr:beta-ketoacyl-[acyl-carrier-protein] synthase family protein [Lentisphaeria bacterium]